MCSATDRTTDTPGWVHALQRWARRNRDTLRVAVATCSALAALVGILVHQFGPSDIERAEADVSRAWATIRAIELESNRHQQERDALQGLAADYRKSVKQCGDGPDVEWVARQRVMALECARLASATNERRDHLVRLSTDYRQRVGQAEREILRARTARECGTPYDVAPRVRELLHPILSNH